jgi:predicted O-methyltransferase YrrM
MGAARNANRKCDEFVVFLTPRESALNPLPETHMTTLTTAPLAPLLNRLFEEADAAEPDIEAAFADLSDEEQTRMLRSKTDYGVLYGRMKNLPLAASRETGALLYMLARSTKAQTIVEFGTSFGISTQHLAAALRDNGGGRLITSEFEPSKAARARDNLKAGGVMDLVEIREGDALETLSVDHPETIDLVLLDGAKALYPEILSLVESRLKAGALVVADNADMNPDYLKRVRSPASRYLSVPFAEDVELSMRLN